MIRPGTYYSPVCDKCGTTDTGSDYEAWADEAAALDEAIAADWCEVDGQLLCPKCQVCHVCGEQPRTFGIGPGDNNVPLCWEHERHYEAEEPTDGQ
ncbi:hypothetical protein [Nocardia sp. NPDC049149]|uniref:hypothetical protein n=1 Tax=Nocardia sp. NPDC049149 TaxID=3364315 RepID=UPI0037126EB6